jgi:hypothetical protein
VLAALILRVRFDVFEEAGKTTGTNDGDDNGAPVAIEQVRSDAWLQNLEPSD